MTRIPGGQHEKPLSPREIEVLSAIRFGLDDREIGAQLRMADGTVRSHVKNIQQKFGARNRAHMVAIGFVQGYLRLLPDAVRTEVRLPLPIAEDRRAA